ncbi:MAG: type III-B CRISPR-associated protein Cas10/Cmr2 [Elusimicrobia bacterium]|nr:type III-B CRISPR-associated protein Cas10/Cmr2 [Elusimicrobiota bacterium]
MPENDNLWKIKIQAILHDTPNKAFLLAEKTAHEKMAKDLINSLGIQIKDKEWVKKIKEADHIASAEDRLVFPNVSVNWKDAPLLIHPLSSEEYELGSLRLFETDKASDSLKEVLREAHKKTENDYKKKFLYIWRFLNEKLKEREDGMGALWDLMPAETRMPQHTIWHHNRIVSAIAGSLPKPALVLMSIGPVQEFINAARSTADFWAGSYILSYLSWQGMKIFAEEFGPDSIIFPDLKGQPLVDKWLKDEIKLGDMQYNNRDLGRPCLPNRWLVIVPSEKAEDLAKKSEKNIKEKWVEMRGNCAKSLNLETEFNLTKKQDSFLEVYWTSMSLPDDLDEFVKQYSKIIELPDDFNEFIQSGKDKYKSNMGTYFSLFQNSLERIMGARKAVKIQKSEPEFGHKCSICGIRESVHDEKTSPSKHSEITEYWEKLYKGINEKYPLAIKKGEQLCSICLVRRMLNRIPKDILGFDLGDNTHFPSVTEIAVSDFKYEVANRLLGKEDNKSGLREDLKNKILEFSKVVEKSKNIINPLRQVKAKCRKAKIELFAKIEGEFLFEATYEKNAEEIGLTEEDKKAAFSLLKEILQITSKFDIARPAPYIGFIYFDGDKMGEWVSGTHSNMPKLENIIHRNLRNNDEIRRHFGELFEKVPPRTPSLQSTISSILLDFSLYTAKYIAEIKNVGKLVYAGGDDALIMCPMSQTLKIARDIREFFTKSVVIEDEKKLIANLNNINTNVKNRISLSMGKNASGSAGIAIAHYHNALTNSLKNARDAEKFAKEKLGRDAFGIAMLKRSGEHSTGGAKWSILNSANDESFNFIDFSELFAKRVISPSFITQLYAELEIYWGMESKGIIIDRVKYLCARHITDDKDIIQKHCNGKEDILQKVIGLINELLFEDTSNLTEKGKLDNFKTLLSFSLFITRYSKVEE